MHIKITHPPQNIEKNRWIDGLSNEEHHKLKCISSSHLKFLAQGESLLSYYSKFILKEQKFEIRKEFTVGTLAHLAVLEPEKFEQSVIVCDIDQRTNDFKQFIQDLSRSNNLSKEPISKVDEEKVQFLQEELKFMTDKLEQKNYKTEDEKASICAAIENIHTTLEPILFPERFEPTKKTKPKKQSENTEFKVTWTKDGGFIDKNGNEKFLVKSEEMKMYRTFQKRFEEHPRLPMMLHDSIIEQTGVAQDPETGLWMSLRGDARNNRGFFLDPKTTEKSLTIPRIEYYIKDYMLPIQAAHYLETANLIEPSKYQKFFFIMMSKTVPYEIAFVAIEYDYLDLGKKLRRKYLNQIAKCEEKGKWPALDYNAGVHGISISMPNYLKYAKEESA